MRQTASASRRFSSRVETPDGVWVYWRCNGREETSRVLDMSLGGLFVESSDPKPVGATAELDFLVEEGQIKAKAVVRHATRGRGLGLKYAAVSDGDRSRLVKLMSRLRDAARPSRP